MIERTFRDIPKGKISEADDRSFLMGLGWSRGATWEDLLNSKRVLIISEAGAGKTHECRSQAELLRSSGQASFFVELSSLANDNLRDLLDTNEEARLDSWLSSQSETATFFLDSFDELKITQGKFEIALKRLKKCIETKLRDARIIVTTRPIPFDGITMRRELPIPPESDVEVSEEAFAKIAMGETRNRERQNKDNPAPWRTVALMPLSDQQIVEFSRTEGVEDPDQLLNDLRQRDAQEFARRPQDLIELCADWNAHKRIRTHSDQVETNIRVKLLPNDDRPELAELSIDKATEGASRLALAMLMTRRLTIRHSAASDDITGDAALDPSVILSDWQPNERKTLLERSLFAFASYGRVRFHNISIAEYLAATRLAFLRDNGMSFKSLKRMLFAETKDKLIVRPSKRSLAGWMALLEDRVFELIRDNEPSVLFNHGDPESLSKAQRNQALKAYADRYGPGGWRGLRIPYIQINRFASPELANEISKIWGNGIENPDVRDLLISLIEVGKIGECADIAFGVIQDEKATFAARINALDALISLNDDRLPQISQTIAAKKEGWTDSLVRSALLRLFPEHMSVTQLCAVLHWVKPKRRNSSDFKSSYARKLVMVFSGGILKLLDTVFEFDPFYDFRHSVCSVEFAPFGLR